MTSPLRVLLFGRSGQVATELRRRAGDGVVIEALGRDLADLSDPAACAAAIRARGGDVIVNAAAFTAVDRAESEEDLAATVNAAAPGAMAEAARAIGAPFLHVSTDYVFDGSGTRPWRPDDPTGPIGAYGRTKRDGERAVLAAGGDAAILRTSWVFSAHGGNFVKTMLRLSGSRDRLSVVADQIGGPTPAAAIADALLTMAAALRAGRGATGLHHFSGAPDASWADFAREIFRRSGRRTAVADITTAEFPTPAARPANSRLDCSGLEAAFGVARPDWRAGLAEVLAELGERAT